MPAAGPFFAPLSAASTLLESIGDLVLLENKPNRVDDLLKLALCGLGSLNERAAVEVCPEGGSIRNVGLSVSRVLAEPAVLGRSMLGLGDGRRDGLAGMFDAFEGERPNPDWLFCIESFLRTAFSMDSLRL